MPKPGEDKVSGAATAKDLATTPQPPETERIVTSQEEQLARSEEIQRIGVERWKAEQK